MNKRGKFSRLIFVLIIAIILVVSITLSNKSEKYLIINDENLKAFDIQNTIIKQINEHNLTIERYAT